MRIKKVLDYKKPGFWVIVSALLLCTIVILCFLTNPKDDERYLHEPFSCHYEVANVVYDSPVYSFSMTTENAPEYYFSEDYELMILEDKESDNWLRAGEFARIELTEDNFDNCFVGASGSGWGKNDARRLRENNDKAWEVHVNGDMNGVFYYLLLQKNGDIYLTYGYSEDTECSIRWVFALEQSELYKYISLADICNELDTDSVGIFDIQEIENRLYVGCAYDGKYGIAFYKKAENGEYILDTVKPQKKFYSHGVDIWADDYVSADDDGNLIDNKVFIVANEHVIGMEWTGDHEESIVISRYPTLVVVDYLKGTGDEQSSYEFVYKETTGLLSDMYVSAQCLYMNMLSSQFGGADSGYKYKITDTGLVLVNRKSGAVESIVSADPGWREFPYSDDEWRDLFVLPSSSQINISNLYDEMLHFRVSEKYSLFKMDEQLWIAEFKENPQMGRFLWSIYALVPESSMGSAVWEYAPMFSSKSPMFKFDFDFEYGELSAVCVTGTLISADEEGQPSGSSLIISEGNALYWVPYVEEGPGFGYAQQAEIMFTVNDGDKMLYDGTIYISVDSHRDASVFYGATIVSGGLHMTQSETDGAIICPA